MERFLFVWLCLVVVFTQLAFAGVHFWAYSIMELAVFVLLGLWILKNGADLFRVKKTGGTGVAGLGSPLSGFFLVFLGIVMLQLLPLSPKIIHLLSPQTARIFESVEAVTGQSPDYTLSLVPHATRVALLHILAFSGAFVLTLVLVRTRSRIRWMAGVLVCLGLFQTLYGIFQTYAAVQESIWWWPKEYYQGNVTGTYINKNNLAGFLELAIPLALGLALSYSGVPKKGQRKAGGKREVKEPKADGARPVRRDDPPEADADKTGHTRRRIVKKRVADSSQAKRF